MEEKRLARFDTIITGGTVVRAVDKMRGDVAIKDKKVVALGHELGDSLRIIVTRLVPCPNFPAC